MQILDGRKAKEFYLEQLKTRLMFMSSVPKLVVIQVGDREDSNSYIKSKKLFADKLGAELMHEKLDSKIKKEEIIKIIKKYNKDKSINGMIVQLPLPDHLNSDEIIKEIDSNKDVDGLTAAGSLIFRPATIEAVFQLLLSQNTVLEGKKIAVVGSEGAVGKKLVEELIKHQPSLLILVDKLLQGTNVETDLKDADIVFSCVPIKGLIKAEYLKVGVIAYDIGLGNFDPSVYEIASEYTPLVGGVGPNTVVALMRNVAKAYDLHMRLAYGL
jgi:methylenetetrahydrofolate dehydrogenase (NADP+)/methenyltetrahydrofolate cyclohydrolase